MRSDRVCAFVAVVLLGISEALQKVSEHKLSFKPPVLTEEDNESRFIPKAFTCDACKAVAYQIYTRFDNFNQKHKNYKYDIPESDLLDLAEVACSKETYEMYGVKQVDGQKVLSGDGLRGKDLPGVLAGGGLWPSRLSNWCKNLSGELDEDEIYSVYKQVPDDLIHFQNYLCYQSGVRGSCKADNLKLEL